MVLLKIFLLLLFLLSMHMFVRGIEFMCTVCVRTQSWHKKNTLFPGAGSTGSCELLCACWERHHGLLQEQYPFKIAKSFLQTINILNVFCFYYILKYLLLSVSIFKLILSHQSQFCCLFLRSHPDQSFPFLLSFQSPLTSLLIPPTSVSLQRRTGLPKTSGSHDISSYSEN